MASRPAPRMARHPAPRAGGAPWLAARLLTLVLAVVALGGAGALSTPPRAVNLEDVRALTFVEGEMTCVPEGQ